MVAIIKAKRTAIGKYNGMYKNISLIDFSSKLLKDISANLKVDEVILGNVLSSSLGQALSRQVTLKAGLDIKIPSFLVNMVCGSGMKSIELGYNNILLNQEKCIIVGGIEKMSDAQNMLKDGLTDAFSNKHMGEITENIVEKYEFTREMLDDFAYLSQIKTKKAIENNIFKEEIYDDAKDEFPRLDIDREKMRNLKACFKENGKITPANTTGLNDGAAMLVLMSKKRAIEEKFEILAEIKAIESIGVDPEYMGLGPIYSTKKLLEKQNLKPNDIDLFEINEAFSAICLSFIKELNLDKEKVNVNGGAIALGHPIGASGARIVVSLAHELKRRNLKRGIATLCIGGGQGISILIERDNILGNN